MHSCCTKASECGTWKDQIKTMSAWMKLRNNNQKYIEKYHEHRYLTQLQVGLTDPRLHIFV